LGHVINSEGIHVDLAKTESIMDWASPKSPTEIRQFLCTVGERGGRCLKPKERIKPLQDRALMMTIELKLPSHILNAQAKAIKEENVKEENLNGMNKRFEAPADGTLYIEKRSWVP
nr:reverse transcriptase domain-containing protein [Tanacetum cinerariifolium]